VVVVAAIIAIAEITIIGVVAAAAILDIIRRGAIDPDRHHRREDARPSDKQVREQVAVAADGDARVRP
jgi:hypothetical protein